MLIAILLDLQTYLKPVGIMRLSTLYMRVAQVFMGQIQRCLSPFIIILTILLVFIFSKKANELFAHTYSNLYNLPTTGLRFFVYGPWGRPDMALFMFTKAILNNETLKVFNYGNHKRDFTYIDDIVEGGYESWINQQSPIKNGLVRILIQDLVSLRGVFIILGIIIQLSLMII